MRRTSRALLLGFALAVAATGGCASASRAGAPADAAAVGARLAAAIEDGYARLEPEVILGNYSQDAVVQTRLRGRLDFPGFRAVLVKDLKEIEKVNAKVSVRDAAIDAGVATVALRLQMDGKRVDGRPVTRDEVYYYRLRQDGAMWKIDQQSYRADFSPGDVPLTSHPPLPAGEGKPSGEGKRHP